MTNTAPIQTLIQAVEQANSDLSLVEAVRNLAACQQAQAIPTLIAVLGYNNPEAAMVAVNGLIALGEAAVIPLEEQLDDYNYGARAYSIRTLATIADPRALDTLATAAATDFAPSVRRAAAKGLGSLQWHNLPPEQVNQAQTKVLETLRQISQDSDWAIRYAAVVGLQALAVSAASLTQVIQIQLKQMLPQETDAAVRSRVLRAQQVLQQTQAIA